MNFYKEWKNRTKDAQKVSEVPNIHSAYFCEPSTICSPFVLLRAKLIPWNVNYFSPVEIWANLRGSDWWKKLGFILWIDKSSILTKHLSEASSETLEVPWYELGP